MDIAIQYQLDRAQWTRILTHALRPQLRLMGIAAWVLLVVGAVMVAVAVLLGGPDRYGMALGAVIMCLGLGIRFGARPLAIGMALRQMSKIMYLPHAVTITHQVVTSESSAAKGEYRWSGVDKVDDVTDMWLLWFGKAQVLPLPKAAFSDADRQTFAQFLVSSGMAGRRSTATR